MKKNKSILSYWFAFFIALLIHSWIFFFSLNSEMNEIEIDHLVNVQLLNEEDVPDPAPPQKTTPPPVQKKVLPKELPKEIVPETEAIAEEEIITETKPTPTPPIESPTETTTKPSKPSATISTQTVDSQNLDNSSFKPFGNKKPNYPAIARKSGIEGWVTVKVLVNQRGKVIKAIINDYSGHSSFKAATLAVANSWRFPAPLSNGQRVQAWFVKKVAFQLRD